MNRHTLKKFWAHLIKIEQAKRVKDNAYLDLIIDDFIKQNCFCMDKELVLKGDSLYCPECNKLVM